jgi:Transcription factor WhiB
MRADQPLHGDHLALAQSWTDRAACREIVTSSEDDLFFAPDSDERRESFDQTVRREVAALAVCEQCPVRAECLAFAVATRQEHGVWGGRTEAQVRRLIAQTVPSERRPTIDHGRRRGEVGLPAASCPAGHAYDQANTYLTAAGKRQCRRCRQARSAAQQQRLASQRTHCPAGHPYDQANTIVTAHGRRRCRACAGARSRAEARRTAADRARRLARGWSR